MKNNNEPTTYGLTQVLIIMMLSTFTALAVIKLDETDSPVWGALFVILFSLLLLAFLVLKNEQPE